MSTNPTASNLLLDAWAVLGAAEPDRQVIRGEPTGVRIGDGEVLAGLDVSGGRHLLVPVADMDSIREDRRSVGVQIRGLLLEESGSTTAYVDVVCLVPRLNELFSDVAADMLEALLLDSSDPLRTCRDVLEQWRQLLERPDPRLLGPQQLAGLYGELLYVRELTRRKPHQGLDAWTGPAKKQHDFARATVAMEVKTSTIREGRSVEIHGHEQLEAPSGGTLFVAFVRLDVELSGQSVPALVEAIAGLGPDRRRLLELLAQSGYDPARAEDYDYPRFMVREQRIYAVDAAFPRIVGSSFGGGRLPSGVLRLRYMIDLTGEPPHPLDEAEVSSLLDLLSCD